MDDDDRARRWELVLPYRARLLGVARQLVKDPGDAEACVQEALTRCVTFPGLDESNVAGFLVTTTRRLCADHYRAQAHSTRVVAKLSARTAPEPGLDEAVCDRAEAVWVTERLADLPSRQRAVVLARAAGHSPQEIAERLAVSYKTVETLLYRVRVRARAELERAYSVVALGCARWARANPASLSATSFAVAAVGLSLLLPASVPGRDRSLGTTPAAVVTTAPRGAAGPTPGPAPSPTPRRAPVPTASGGPSGSKPTRTPGPPLSPCPFPPYLADPCVSPSAPVDPVGTVARCARYGVHREPGLTQCGTEPTPSPTGPDDHDGGDS